MQSNTLQIDVRIGKQYRVRDNIVTVTAFNEWDGVEHVCVYDPTTLNPANIPGLDHYWIPFAALVPLESPV